MSKPKRKPKGKSKAGRKPKPTKLKVFEGNRGNRPLPENEPEPKRPASCPKPPRGMPAEGKRLWNTLAPELYRLGLLTILDLDAFEMLCEWYAVYKRAMKEVRAKHGLVVKSMATGTDILSPHLTAAGHARKAALGLMADFGLSPKERVGMIVGSKGEDEEVMDRFFKRGEGTYGG